MRESDKVQSSATGKIKLRESYQEAGLTIAKLAIKANVSDDTIQRLLGTKECPNGVERRSVSGSRDKTLKVWDLTTRKKEFILKSHSDSVKAVAITPNGKRAISGSKDNTVKVWDLSSGNIIASFTGESSIACCAIAPDGLTIVAGDTSGRLYFLRLEGMEALT